MAVGRTLRTRRDPYVRRQPYPAPFLLPFFATDLLGHAGGFAAWTLLNILALYAAIVRGLRGPRLAPGRSMNLAPFAFLPFLYNLYLGQLLIVMSFGLYRSLRPSRRAASGPRAAGWACCSSSRNSG